METINLLQSEPTPTPIIESNEPKVHPLLQAMQELKEEGIVEAKESIKDQLEKAYLQDGGDISQYFVRSSKVDKLGFSPKQIFARSPDLDHPKYDIDYIGNSVGNPALWFYPLTYYLKSPEVFTKGYPYIWLVKLKPDAWLQPVDKFTKTKQDAPQGKERVGIIRKALTPSAIFFKPAFDVVDKFYDYGGQHKRHGEVKGAPVDEEIAYHGSIDDINQFHPFTHFGTEKAAKDRMTYKKIKDGKIYKVDLDIKNPLTIKDFPGIHYDRLYAFELRDKGLISQEEMEAITMLQDKAELRKALLNKLNELGIDGFVYKNKYEDKGNISYVIVDPSQVKVLSVEPAAEEVTEASPDTLEGSFTPDLVESKTWLCEKLAKGLKGKNAGTIYALGSWYGNIGIFLEQAGVQFDKLVLVEPDEEALMRSKELLDPLNDQGKLILIHQNAEDVVYEKPGVVINTSCNETGPVFLTKLPDNMLCLLQARNNNENTLFPTEDEEDFTDYFPLEKVYYTGKKQLEDPEVNYVRYMKIGRTGKKLDETISTDQGGGSAGVGGGQMVGGPTTYEQEYDMFKRKGPRRITAMTNEALDSYYPYEGKAISGRYTFETEDGVFYKVYFGGRDLVEVSFSAILPGEEENFRPDKTTLTGTGNSRKVFGTVVKIVQDYVETHEPKTLYFTADGDEPSRIKLYNALISQVDKALPDYYAHKPLDLGSGKAYMLKRKEDKLDEALDSSYKYLPGKLPGTFYFDTEDGQEYKVEIDKVDNDVIVAFSARGQGDEHKTGITGTGNSRKIFGTVIKIVKDYIRKSNPEIIAFSADNSEPSRVRLYKMLAAQANKELPNYNFTDAFSNGGLTTYYLTRDGAKVPAMTKVKAKAGKALDKVFENSIKTVTLFNLYDGAMPDNDERIWNYVGDSDFDIPFEVHTIQPFVLDQILCDQYGVDDVEDLFRKMQPDQEEIIRDYQDDPNLSQQIIVMHGGNQILDGNHRALAAVLANKPIKYIDVSEEEEL